MWHSRILCAFKGTEWAHRHCSAPDELDSTANVFDNDDDDDDSQDDDRGRNTTDDENDDGGNDDNPQLSGNDSRAPTRAPVNLNVPICSASQQGSFYVSPAAQSTRDTAQSTVVAFAYQVQGTIDLNVSLLRTEIVPLLERELSAALVPALFAPEACRLTVEQQLAQIPAVTTYNFVVEDEEDGDQEGDDSNNRFRHRRRLGSLANGPADAPVTGLQATPDDRLLPDYEGGEYSTTIRLLYC